MEKTKISFLFILLATIPSCLAFTLEQIRQDDELYVVKYPTENELTCFSKDDDTALVWNDDLRTREPSDDFNNFEPVKPMESILMNSDCAIWKSRKCFIEWSGSVGWRKVSTATNPMAPVYDFRWEGFKEYVVDNVESKNVLSLDSEDRTIIFSIRGTNDVQIHLCKDTTEGLHSCPVIKFAVDGVYSSIQYCELRETRCHEKIRTDTRETAFLNADEWRTFRLQWIKNERNIKVFRDTYERVSLQSTLQEFHNIFISSSAVARIRFHDYNYILSTSPKSIMPTKEFDWSDDFYCVNMLISLCRECYMTVSLIDRSVDTALASIKIYRDDQFYSSGLREWQPVKLTSPSKSSSRRQVQLHFSTGLNNEYQKDIWWAIDDLRLCEQNDGVRKSTIKIPRSDQTGVGTSIKCQKLLRGTTAVADLSTSLPPHDTTRLSEYVKNLTKSYFPGCRGSSTTNCNDIDSTSNRQNEAGVRCFCVIPGKRNFTLDETSNPSPCRNVVGRFPVLVIISEGNDQLDRQTCSTLPCQLDIEKLQPFTTYNVVVRPIRSEIVFEEDMKTLESAPGMIRDVIFESITATSVKGKWNRPVHANGIIRNYTVTIQAIEFLGCRGYKKPSPPGPKITKNVTDTTASFFGLHPYTTYRFEVIANTVEPGLPYPKSFDTQQLNNPTSEVSNLRIVNESILVWDPPANCTAITGFTNLTKLVFRGVSEWMKNFTHWIVISYHKYDLNRLDFSPHTKYGVCAYVVGNHLAQVNSSNCQEVQWTTAPGAPPAVKDVQIYDADAFGETISVKCKPPYPSYGEIESYQVSIINIRPNIIANWLVNVSESNTCKQFYVCIENLSLPSTVSTTANLELQISAKNTNVSAREAVSEPKLFQLNDLYNKAPGKPQKLRANPSNHGIVMLTWSHPSFTPTKIVRFMIQVNCLSSNLTTHPCKNILPIYYNITNAEEKSYSMELYLQTSTEYRLHVMALNYRNNISMPTTKIVATSGSVSFANKDEPKVINAKDVVTLEIPAVLNATMHTTIVVKVEGLSLCAPNSSRNKLPSKNKTKITIDWDAVKCPVNSSQPVNFSYKLSTNQHYSVQEICRCQRMETYRFVVTLTDPAIKEPLILETAPIAFTDKKSPPKEIKTWLVILIPILVICLLLLIIFIWYRKHKRARDQSSDACNLPLVCTMNTPSTSPCTSQRFSVAFDTKERHVTIEKKEPDVVPHNPHSYPVKVEEFEKYAKEAIARGVLDSQFETFPTSLMKQCEIGRLPENKVKNRFKDIIPYDDNRVVLKSTDEDSTSDYINASYVQGYRKVKAYIATQGPIRNQKTKVDTVPDFWRMVWQENVRIICMLANVKENNKKKCEKYWPEVGESVTYNDIEISNIQHEVFADYTIRTFDVRCQSTKRKIMHFHYTGWPDHGVPTYTQSLVAYLKKLLATPAGKGPIVAHCSAGVGRTGTIILCDICLRQAVKERVIDVPATTLKMRQDRVCMVQSSQQYLLAHLVILESMTPAQTLIHCNSQLNEKIAELRKQLPVDVKRLGEIVWQDRVLHKLAERPDLEEVMQDRTSHFDTDCPDLTQDGPSSTPVDEKSPIDVVTVDGYKGKEQYLATQLPTPSTLAEFWRLIAEKRIELIVVLQRPRPKKSVHCDIKPAEPSFAPLPHLHVEAKSTPEDMGHFTIEKVSVTDTSEEGRRRIEFAAEPDEEGVQPVTIITCTGWERKVKGTPPPATGLVSLWIASEKIRRKETPTLVMCHDGVTGCGLYLALSFLLEWMAVERECDVISAVRAIRRFRPGFVQSLQQFEYLYDAAIDYNKYFENYANFS